MPLSGTIAAIRAENGDSSGFWDELRQHVATLAFLPCAQDMDDLLCDSSVLQAVIIDGSAMTGDTFVRMTQTAERMLREHDVPLICLAAEPFRKPEAMRPDAILTHPVPVETVLGQIRSLSRLKTKKVEAAVRVAALGELGIEVPRPFMQISGSGADNRPALLVVGTRGNYSQIESVLGAKVQVVSALTGDMANLYLGWRSFDAVILDQPNSEALDTLLLLRANPLFHDLPVILLTEGLDAPTARQAYLARANDVMSLRSTRADLFLRLTTGIRMRRMDRQTQEMLLRTQDALDGGNGTISADSFKCYLSHAKDAARRSGKSLSVTRLAIETVTDVAPEFRAVSLEQPALRLIRRLVRIEDLVMHVPDTGVITVFPGTDAINTERAVTRIRGIMRNTPVTLDIGMQPLKLDAAAKVAVVNTAA